MSAFLAVWVGFGAVWVASLVGLAVAVLGARARGWLSFRAQLRAGEREVHLVLHEASRKRSQRP